MKAGRNISALPESYRGREQTYIKHLILERYLDRVVRNILWSQREFVFIDGFSGPWESRSSGYSDTSFGIAMRLLRRVRDEIRSTRSLERRVRCVFVERGASAYARLAKAVEATPFIQAHAIRGRFEDRVEEVLQHVGNAFALVSVDPKGWSFDLKKLAPLLRHRPSEVIVNLMFEHLNRFLDDKRTGIRRSFVPPLGADWRSRLDALLEEGLGREEAILELFREQLKIVGDFGYVLSARIQRPTSDRSHFHLVYGTRHEKGLIEFRKVEKEAMDAEEHSRIEAKHAKRTARTGMDDLFSAAEMTPPRSTAELRAPEIGRACTWLQKRLRQSKTITYPKALVGVLERFSITEPELKDVLVSMRRSGQVVFDGMMPMQRKPDRKVTIVARLGLD